MGIHGIYKEIGPGQRIALAKLAVDKFQETGKPLRLAIDTSIWLFQIQSGKGGTNPALRTFYYRLLRMISLNIHPIFVFDGPNKPPFKRNKRTGPNVASIPEFLAKQLLKHFGFPMHMAPGEAEAECALLQREGVVDAVLSEDVDTLMFGSKITIRNWSAQDKGKSPTHVNLYNASETKSSSGLDREGMILVALMSGGDYVPQGIPGCGPKIACEAAKAGFGRDLCKVRKNDSTGYSLWRSNLSHELRTNESKYFKSKHKALTIPEDFPSTEILGYYTHPAISTVEKVRQLEQSLSWDRDLDFQELRSFTGDAFDWRNFSGAKKFVRNLAQSLLLRELRLGAQSKRRGLVKGIHGVRTHPSTDNVSELRISYIPLEVVNVDLSAEPPDDEYQVEQLDMEEGDVDGEPQMEASTQSAKSKPYLYDPSQLDKIWIPEAFVRIGEPEKYDDWKNGLKKAAAKFAEATALRSSRGYRTKAKGVDKSMPKGALNSFVSVAKASSPIRGSNPRRPENSKTHQLEPFQAQPFRPPPARPATPPCETISLLTSSPAQNVENQISSITPTTVHDWLDLPSTVTKRRKRSPMRRAHTYTNSQSLDKFFRPDYEQNDTDLPVLDLVNDRFENTPKRPKGVQKAKTKTSAGVGKAQSDIFSSPSRSSIVFYLSQPGQDRTSASAHGATAAECLDLTISSPLRPTAKPSKTGASGSSNGTLNTVDEDVEDEPLLLSLPHVLEDDDEKSLRQEESAELDSLDLTMTSPSKSAKHSNQVDVSSTTPMTIRRRSPRSIKNTTICTSTTSQEDQKKLSGVDPRKPLSEKDTAKQWVRVRKSLAGAFAVEEGDTPMPAEKKAAGRWRLNDVHVLDLT